MRFHVGHVAAGSGVLALAFAATAEAGTLTATNACLYSVNGEYRDQAVTLGGVGSPRDAAAGATATLSGAYISAKLPPSLPKTGYDLGVFKAGRNPIPSRVWIAIAAANATPATQVRELSVTASTTIKVATSGRFVSGTPIVVRIPIADTTWTVSGSRSGRLLAGRGGHAAEPADRRQRPGRPGRRQHHRQAEARQPALHHGLPAGYDGGAVQEPDARARRAVRDARGRQPRRAGRGGRVRSARDVAAAEGSRPAASASAIACPAGSSSLQRQGHAALGGAGPRRSAQADRRRRAGRRATASAPERAGPCGCGSAPPRAR